MTPDQQGISDAAWNAVAVASIAHREAEDSGDLDAARRERVTFVRVLDCARSKGLTNADLCRASGLDEAYLVRLITEAGPEQAARVDGDIG